MAIDLEHFPTNETALRMMERISPIYDRSYVGKWIFEIMGMEMGEARAYFEELRQQPFPERTTWAIGYWERRYAITPKPTDDLETRRRNIIMKRGARLPMNPARMEQIIDGLTGGTSTVTENVDDYTFRVTINGMAIGKNLSNVIHTIKKNKPSHQNFEFFVILQAKEPVIIRVGGSMGIHAQISTPSGPDIFDFRTQLHIGGTSGILSAVGIPEDTYMPEPSSTVRVGGIFAARTVLSVPEDSTLPGATTILRTGGVCTIISNLSGGSD